MRTKTEHNFLPPAWVIVLAVLGVFIWLLVVLKELMVLLVVGYCVAYIVEPVIRRLERRGISRPIAVLLLFLIATMLFLLAAVSVLPLLLREAQDLLQNLPQYIDLARENLKISAEFLRTKFPYLDKYLERTPDLLNSVSAESIMPILAGAGLALMQGYSAVLMVVNTILLPFIVFYLVVDFPKLHQSALGMVPGPYQRRVREIATEINTYVSAFVRGQFIVCSILFLLYAAGFGLIGIKLWFIVALISGYGNLVPFLGTIVGIFLASLMALVTFGDFWHLLQIWMVFALVQGLEGFLITPRVIGNKVGLSPLVVLIALVVGGQLAGLLGIFLAIPVAAALRVLSRHCLRWLAVSVQQTS